VKNLSTVERRRLRIAKRLAEGQSPSEIAYRENVTIRTVYNVRARLQARHVELETARR
jgi:DNA-binding CsgD family transcriptional regulator